MTMPTLILLALLVVSLRGLVASSLLSEKLSVKRQLELLNKPAVKSFTTEHGQILDCVEIHKQLAFDHPLLKNHSIQTKHSFGVTKATKQNDGSSKGLRNSLILPKNIKCPPGTVIVKRITAEDLILNERVSSSIMGMYKSSNSSYSGHPKNESPVGLQIAIMTALVKNTGVGGKINTWYIPATKNQHSTAYITVENRADGNAIQAGWAVLPDYFPNNNRTQLFAYWTSDAAVKTGCVNTLCPGFVQLSKELPLGLILPQISTSDGEQYTIALKIKQDVYTKDWLLLTVNEPIDEIIGYWPKEIFTVLANEATQVGWGGLINSPTLEPSPGMGSGRFPEDGFGKACFISNLEVFGVDEFPGHDDVKYIMSKIRCYRALHKGVVKDFGQMMYFGGPPYCQM